VLGAAASPHTCVWAVNYQVPTQQRGLYNAFWNWQSTFMGFTVNGLGALVGERKLSDSSAYILSIIVVLFPTLPIGMVGLSEAAPDIRKCPLGWWLPEVKRVEPEPTGADLRQKAKLGSRCTPSGAQLCLGDFVSAFAYPPFRWLFVTTVMNTVSFSTAVSSHNSANGLVFPYATSLMFLPKY
jgi:hypothetical protein